MLVPSRSWFDPTAGAYMHTGQNAIDVGLTMLPGNPMAADIETPGLNTYTINCITFAWRRPTGEIDTVLLDPRVPGQWEVTKTLMQRAGSIIFHNGPFDVPILHHNKLITMAEVAKINDTIIHARMAFPDGYIMKNLEALSKKHLGLDELTGGMLKSFHAAGYKNKQAGYEGMDIASPIYRVGAMMDTVCTLKLEPILLRKCFDWLTDHPFQAMAATSTGEAREILERQHKANRILLRRSCTGLAVDPDYLVQYAESVDVEKQQAIALLASCEDEKGPLVGGAGKAARIVKWLDAQGHIPSDWPRTKGGALSGAKDDLDRLDHPIAKAQRTMAQIEKIEQYINKVQTQYEQTGRCHPQVNILGASQSGRISVNSPEYHQFSERARPIIADDGQGLTSIDWSQIEPVTMALMAHDHEFLAPFEAGEDLYEPIVRSTGQPRKIAKVVLLAAMYGQSVRSLAGEIGHTAESAAQIRRQMFAAMPGCAKWMNKVTGVADTYARVVTVGGRILPVTMEGSYKSVNHVCQGSAADILIDSIIRIDEAGLGDHIQLTMHDEIVVDTEVGEECERIMSTPPDFLVAAAGRSIVLRTDRNDMGHQWLKV